MRVCFGNCDNIWHQNEETSVAKAKRLLERGNCYMVLTVSYTGGKLSSSVRPFCLWHGAVEVSSYYYYYWWWWWWWLFSSRAWIWGECSTIHSRPAIFFFFFKVEISSRTLISLFRPGSVHSGSVSWDDCDRVFPDELRLSSFPDRFPHFARKAAWSAHSDFVGS